MNIKRLLLALVCVSILTLGGCNNSAPPNDNDKSIAMCQEAMKIHSQRKQSDGHTTEKLQHGCKQSANMRTPAQWQCVLDGLNKGGDYIPISSQCFGLEK